MEPDLDNICANFKREMWFYLDQSLAQSKRVYWENHLKACSTCRRQLHETEQALSFCASEPLACLDEKVLSGMLERAVAKSRRQIFSEWIRRTLTLSGVSFPFPAFGFARIAVGAAMIAFIAIVFLVFLKSDPVAVPNQDIISWKAEAIDLRINRVESSIQRLQSKKKRRTLGQNRWRSNIRSLGRRVEKIRSKLCESSM